MSGTSYECLYCGKLRKTKAKLKCHTRIHIGAKPYSCGHCSERFTRPNQLKRQRCKSHNEGTWLTCHICQTKFSLCGNVNEHVRRYEGVKPYVCSECPKCFCTTYEPRSNHSVHLDYNNSAVVCVMKVSNVKRAFQEMFCHGLIVTTFIRFCLLSGLCVPLHCTL